jgi:hypothetical protein
MVCSMITATNAIVMISTIFSLTIVLSFLFFGFSFTVYYFICSIVIVSVSIQEEVDVELRLGKATKPQRWSRPEDLSLISALKKDMDNDRTLKSLADSNTKLKVCPTVPHLMSFLLCALQSFDICGSGYPDSRSGTCFAIT